MNIKRISLICMLILFCGAGIVSSETINAPGSKTIIEEWHQIKIPSPPVLNEVSVEPKTTALLILDIQSNLVNKETRPRAVDSVPKISNILKIARSKGMLVVYSIAPSGTPADILKEVAPLKNEPVVKSGVDKFYGTGLEKILSDSGIKTVIITGTSAHGAVLNTATGAALRNMRIVVPVDCMSADNPYAEQYTAWHLLNSPGTRNKVTLTKTGLIKF